MDETLTLVQNFRRRLKQRMEHKSPKWASYQNRELKMIWKRLDDMKSRLESLEATPASAPTCGSTGSGHVDPKIVVTPKSSIERNRKVEPERVLMAAALMAAREPTDYSGNSCESGGDGYAPTELGHASWWEWNKANPQPVASPPEVFGPISVCSTCGDVYPYMGHHECCAPIITIDMIEAGFAVLCSSGLMDPLLESGKCTVADIYRAMEAAKEKT